MQQMSLDSSMRNKGDLSKKWLQKDEELSVYNEDKGKTRSRQRGGWVFGREEPLGVREESGVH